MTDLTFHVEPDAWLPVAELLGMYHPHNSQTRSAEELGAIKRHLTDEGFMAEMIVINPWNGKIVSGHGRTQAAHELGYAGTLPVVYKEYPSEAGHRRAMLRWNLARGHQDPEKQAQEFADLLADFEQGDLAADFGMEDGEFEELLAEWGEDEEPPVDPGPQVDRAEELREKWGVETGQLWKLGEHRLICGDCTDAAVVERVMGGEKAGAVVTDSPYGINREGIENDDPEGLRQLFDGCLAAMPVDNAVIINFQSPRLFPVWLDALRAAGHKFARALWMYDENDQTKPWHYWLMCSQIIFVSTVGNPEWQETKAHHDTYVIGLSREWRAGGDGNDFAHASVKPVGVVADLLSHTTGIVYDPFSGSGTTLIACEQLSRRCRAVEISPAYVSVALQRWADMTGQTPELLP